MHREHREGAELHRGTLDECKTTVEARGVTMDDEFNTGCTDACPDDCMADHAGEQ